jgi:hypothetical protein
METSQTKAWCSICACGSIAITGTEGHVSDGGAADNVILNSDFNSGLDGLSGSGCKIELHGSDSLDDGLVPPVRGKYIVVVTGRTNT